jgi:gliding motility-associated-like protein
MLRKLYIVLGLFGSASVYSQTNLVLNYSFEQFDSCTSSANNISVLSNWANANAASPDYFNPCNGADVSVPWNLGGYQQPHFGNGYAGIGMIDITNYREGIEGILSSPLQAGKYYCFEMYVSLADTFYYAIDKLGISFSNDSILASDFPANSNTLNYQIELDVSQLGDTSSWYLTSLAFFATGGERYFVISYPLGLTWTKFRPNSANDRVTYYYIDDVRLFECPPPILPIIIPNVFTPNEDGINDTFSIQNLPPNSVLKIYNRWGFVVHESTDYHNDWNGTTAGGQKVSDGTYFIYLQTPDGTRYSGTLNVFDAH